MSSVIEVVAVLAGVLCGIITGVVPGLHLNSFIPFLLGLPGLTGFVVGVAISHSFFDFFPAVFLGVPDESTALSVLPAHRLVLRGRALKALQLSVCGGLFSTIFAVALIPAAFILCQWLPFAVLPLLVLVCAFMLLSPSRKMLTLLVFFLAGLMGLQNIGKPHAFLAMLSGFFGASTILFSLVNNPRFPPQKREEPRLPGIKPLFFGCLAGFSSGLLPGVSSSISGLAAKKLGKVGSADFLAVLGGTNTVYALTAILALDIIGRPRSGAAILIGQSPGTLFLVGSGLLAVGASAFLALQLSAPLVRVFERAPKRLLNIVSLIFLCALALYFNVSFLFATSTALGLFCAFSGVRKSTCMASLLVPVIFYYIL